MVTDTINNAAQRDRLSEIWRNLSKSDKEYLLGHTSDELTDYDRSRLSQIINNEGNKLRESFSQKKRKFKNRK